MIPIIYYNGGTNIVPYGSSVPTSAQSNLPELMSNSVAQTGPDLSGMFDGVSRNVSLPSFNPLMYSRNSLVGAMQAHSYANPQRGSYSSGSIESVNGLTPKLQVLQIHPKYAEMIDNYFSKYGYKTMKLKTPNIEGRANWNYVKTNDAHLDNSNVGSSTGKAPQEAIDVMCKTLDNGITFWHNLNTMGNYALSNPIVEAD